MNSVFVMILMFSFGSVLVYALFKASQVRGLHQLLATIHAPLLENSPISLKETNSPDISIDIKLINDILKGESPKIDTTTFLSKLVEQVQNSNIPSRAIVIARSASIENSEIQFALDILTIGKTPNGS